MIIKIEKYLICIFIIYLLWFKEAYINIPLILYGTVFLGSALFFLDLIIVHKRIKLSNNSMLIKMFFLYGIISLITGTYICTDTKVFVKGLFTYFSFLTVCFLMDYVSAEIKNYNWILKCLLVVAVICSLQVLFFPYAYYNGVIVTTMGMDNNPNSLGLVMCAGIFSVFILVLKKEIPLNLCILSIAFLFLYVIVLTGSRKCLFAGFVTLLMLLFNFIKIQIKDKKEKVKMIVVVLLGIVILILCRKYLLNNYLNTSSFIRVKNLFESHQTNIRLKLYYDALEFLERNIFFGIGFNQYLVLSPYKIYSHSSYAEILSCTGLVGTVIFFTPFLILIVKLIKFCFIKKNTFGRIYEGIFFILLVELFLGMGQIFIYEFLHMILLTYIFGEVKMTERRRKKYGNKKKNR